MEKLKEINNLYDDIYKYEDDLLEEKRIQLNKDIDSDIKTETKDYILSLLNKIKSLPDQTKDELKLKEWLYNDGCFRTSEEITDYNNNIKNRIYYETEWETESNYGPKAWVILITSFFIIPIGISLSMKHGNFNHLVASVILTFILLITDIIYIAVKSNQVRKNAIKHNIPANDRLLYNANIDSHVLICYGLKSAHNISTHAGIKFNELINPDIWSIHV